jgi:hypothetical protein
MKKGERWDQNELRRDGTINTHPFSHSWPGEVTKRKGEGNFSDFPSPSLRENT